jgi:predicted lactoylglutathione lyase
MDAMPSFKALQINLYSHDLHRAVAFYSKLGFVERFARRHRATLRTSSSSSTVSRLASRPSRPREIIMV